MGNGLLFFLTGLEVRVCMFSSCCFFCCRQIVEGGGGVDDGHLDWDLGGGSGKRHGGVFNGVMVIKPPHTARQE